MRAIIAGSRGYTNYEGVERAVKLSGFTITVVVSGAARGADKLGEMYATRHKIPVVRFPADWGKYGKSAGYRRNTEMAENADAVIALWDGQSRGTRHMIDIATARGLEVYVYRTDIEELL